MAEIRRKILGVISGKLADFVFRERNGKVIIYRRPARQKVSKSAAALEARKKFAITVALAKEINSKKLLSDIWKRSKVKATNAYQKIIKENSSLIYKSNLTLLNKITPDGINYNLYDIKYSKPNIEIKLEFEEIPNSLLQVDNLFCLLYLYKENSTLKERKDKSDFTLKLFQFKLGPIKRNKSQTIKFSIGDLLNNNFDGGNVYLALSGNTKNKFIYTLTFAKKIF